MPWILAALVVYVLFLGRGNPLEGALTAIAQLTRGARLTHSPADSTGLVDAAPEDLADEAGLSLEAYSAARMLSSEEGQTDPTTQAAIVWCLINEASRRGTSITSLLTRAKNPRNAGYYGSQKDKDPDSDNLGNSDRYASTALDPYERDGQIAEQCLSGAIPDMTGGATNFDRPAGEKHPETVAANRVKAGLALVAVDGAAEGLRFWRPA
jgi:hypothetical protein